MMTCNFYRKQEKRPGWLIIGTMLMLAVLFLPQTACATGVSVPHQGSVGAGLPAPWEGPLATLAQSFTGPVAMALALLMIVIGVGVLMFGGDLSGWARWVAFALVAAGTLGGAGTIVNALGMTGAII